MLRMDLDAAALARARFAISPLHTTVDALYLLREDAPAGGGGWRGLLMDTVRDRGLGLLAGLFAGSWDYVPDFIKPEPRGHEDPLHDELHAVATVDADRLRYEIELMVAGQPEENLKGRTAPRALLELLEHGEGAVAERFAAELHQVWHDAIRPQWGALRARMEADIAYRAQTVMRQGMATALGGLHPRLVWNEDHVRLITRFRGCVPDTTRLVLAPSAFASDLHMTVDDLPGPMHRQPLLTYPARRGPDTGPEASPPAHALLGVTRARLLSDLRVPRSTSELSERHFLAASTVSYHLSILHRSGLVTRTRARHRIVYAQTDRAASLLAGAE